MLVSGTTIETSEALAIPRMAAKAVACVTSTSLSYDQVDEKQWEQNEQPAPVDLSDEEKQIQLGTLVSSGSRKSINVLRSNHKCDAENIKRCDAMKLPTLSIGRAVVRKAVIHVRAARHIIAQIAVPDHIHRDARQRANQRQNDNDRVQHFFASCDVLERTLPQAAQSPKT